VGDRVLTDVVFANQAGMLSVLVRPLSRLRDHPVAIVMRLLEDLLLTLVRLFYERVKNHRWQ
jgi:predicted HAD superfamily phosphohydrolase YqeG